MKNKYDILIDIPEKNLENKDTTSLKWKRDLIDFFHDKNLNTCLEIGTCNGVTTKVLSTIFYEVDTLEFNLTRMKRAEKYCDTRSNIKFYCDDAYNKNTYSYLRPYYDAVVIDCIHIYENVIFDINQALTRFNEDRGIYLIFDDYGHPDSPGVNQAVNEAISAGLKLECYIGEHSGFIVNRTDGTGFTMIDHEGVILSYGK